MEKENIRAKLEKKKKKEIYTFNMIESHWQMINLHIYSRLKDLHILHIKIER